jgi:hypothetical protein
MIPIEVVLNGTPVCDEVDTDFGHRARTKRIKRVVEAMQSAPDKSYPELFGDDSELEGFYRLLRNPNLTFEKILDAHCGATAQRCQSLGEVLAIHDTTEFSFPLRDESKREFLCRFSKSRQGFLAHTTIGASADGLRAPLGCLGLRPFVHKKGSDEKTRKFWDERSGAMERESQRWWEAVVATEARLKDVETVIHVMDREADIYGLLARMDQAGYRHVIRAAQDRSVIVAEHPELSRMFNALDDQEFLATRTVELSPRSHANMPPAMRKSFPVRRQRSATLSFRALSVTIRCPRNGLKELPREVKLNVVEAVEQNPPAGQEPVRWLLLTTEKIDTIEDVFRVVDLYRTRWIIEEYFKAIKTGCAYRKRQLNNAKHLLVALAITLPVAWKLLVMRHLERQCPEAPAHIVVDRVQLRILQSAVPKMKWSSKPTLGQVTLAIASLGGHLKSNGRPGWQTLGRGYRKLVEMEAGWHLAMATMSADKTE